MTQRLSLAILIVMMGAMMGAGVPLYSDTADTASSYTPCALSAGKVCYHTFGPTDTTTTADSDPYEVDMCDTLTYKFDGDGGTAALFVKECSSLSAGACVAGDTSVFTADIDADGLITASDEAQTLNGDVGRRGYKKVAPGAKWHYIDVQSVPSSQTVHVSIKCHK